MRSGWCLHGGAISCCFSPPKYAYCIYDAKFNQLTMFSQSAFQVQSGMTWNGALGTPKTPPPGLPKHPSGPLFHPGLEQLLKSKNKLQKFRKKLLKFWEQKLLMLSNKTSEVSKKTSEVVQELPKYWKPQENHYVNPLAKNFWSFSKKLLRFRKRDFRRKSKQLLKFKQKTSEVVPPLAWKSPLEALGGPLGSQGWKPWLLDSALGDPKMSWFWILDWVPSEALDSALGDPKEAQD